MLNPIFEKFVEKSPVSVMARGMMERVLNPAQLDQWFEKMAEVQYTKVCFRFGKLVPRLAVRLTVARLILNFRVTSAQLIISLRTAR